MAGRRQDTSTPAARPALRRRAWGGLLVAAVAAALLPGPAGAADDPAGTAPAVVSGAVVSGVAGSKAALVRIEVSAVAEIAHIDHSTGDVNVVRGRYEVPIRTGTGVFTSADGVIATTGTTLLVTPEQVVVHAANRLFQEQMGTALVGNDGDLSRRAQAADPYWAPHLQHCYDQVEHCVLFFVPQYEAFPYTQRQTGAPADVLHTPEAPADVGLLQVSGGGGTPTAQLLAADGTPPAQRLLTGFTDRPGPDVGPSDLGVSVDPATGALTSDDDAGALLSAGVGGGPVLDPRTGEVTGLATAVDGALVVTPTRRLHEVLAAAGSPPNASQFDTVFRRGVDHLTSGSSGASATSAFEEALEYWDSALAAQYLQQAADLPAEAASSPGPGADGGVPGWVWAAAGLAVLAVLGAVVVARRRAAGTADEDDPAAPSTRGTAPIQHAAATTVVARPETTRLREATAAPPRPGPPSSAGGQGAPAADRTRGTQPPALVADRRPADRAAAAWCSDCGDRLRTGARYCAACGSPVS